MPPDPSTITVAAIDPAQWQAYKHLCLRMLREEPQAFGSSVEIEEAMTDTIWQARVSNPLAYALGASVPDGNLVGMMVCVTTNRPKQRHIGTVASAYVAPEYRHQHLGARLLDGIIAYGQALKLHKLNLSVVVDQQAAVALYTSRGFATYGTEPAALCVDGKYYTEWHMAKLLTP